MKLQKKKTSRRTSLILDNGSGHFIRSEKDNVKTWYLLDNIISWKQPCDLGIIAALEKR